MNRVILLEVYGLNEDSRGRLKSMLKMHPAVADELHKADPKNSFLLGKLYRDRYVDEWSTDDSDPFQFKAMGHSLGYEAQAVSKIKDWLIVGTGAKILKAIKADPNLPSRIKNKNFDDAMDVIDNVKSPEEIKKDVIHEFSDGFYWLDLKSTECDVEARKMGHCGSDPGAGLTLISLRDKSNNPHVTMSLDERDKEITQIKGKQNKLPDRKYWKYIEELFKKKSLQLRDDEIIQDADQDQEIKNFLKAIDPSYREENNVAVSDGRVWTMTGPDKEVMQGNAALWKSDDPDNREQSLELSISSNNDVWNISTVRGLIPQRSSWQLVSELLDKIAAGQMITLHIREWDSDYDTMESDRFIDYLNNNHKIHVEE